MKNTNKDKKFQIVSGISCRVSRVFEKIASAFKVVSYSAVFLASVLVMGGPAMALDERFNETFPYVAVDSDIRDVLNDMARRIGVSVRIDPDVQGAVTADNSSGDVRAFLEDVLAQSGATWWYDGVILYIEPQDALTTALVVSQGLAITEIEEELAALDLLDARFPLAATGDGAVIRIIGPRGYVDQVRSLVETLIQTRRARTATPEEVGLYIPRVFHGRGVN